MKRYLLLLLFGWTNLSIALAQKIKETEVPSVVKASFTKTFPDLKAKWKKEKDNYEASFKKDGKTMSATFLPDGVFVESEEDIKQSELPASAMDYVKENYKNQKVKETAKIASAGGTVTYEAEVSGIDLVFDSNGRFLKEVKD